MKSFTLPVPSVPLLEGKADTISITWYRFFLSLFGAAGSGSVAKDFSPVDASGLAPPLDLHAIFVQTVAFGGMIYMFGQLTYPTTTDTTNAALSLPLQVPNQRYAEIPGVVMVNIAQPIILLPSRNSSRAVFVNQQTSANITNATLSGLQVNFTVAYPQS